MKIWYQSLSAYRYEPVWDTYGKTLEQQCKRVLCPDTEIYVTGTAVMVREIDRFKSMMYYHTFQVLNSMFRAEREGFDAFVIGCTFDSGMEEGREMLSMPVVGISQASYYLAAILGKSFATVTIEPFFCERYRQLVEHYGLQDKYLKGDYYFESSEEEVARSIQDPQPMLKKFIAAAEKAIADGASVIVPNPGFLASLVYKGKLTKIGDVPVLDPVAVAVKTAETLVDFRKIGIEVSRKLQVYGSPSKELLKESFKKYEKIFKIDY